MPLFTTQPADRTVSVSLGYRADIKIGGKDKDRFLPSINMSFGRSRNDEFFINFRADDKVVITGQEKIILADDLTEIETPGRKDRVITTVDGKLDYQVDLLERPENPWIDLIIRCSPELVFDHQPALTKEDIADGCERPDNIINSYAVYCDKKNNDYQTGKVMHHERSWIRTPGSQVWTQQEIAVKNGTGRQRIFIPPELYAAWPVGVVTIGPIIGYDTVGGSTTVANTRAVANGYTMPVAGKITRIYMSGIDFVGDLQFGIYSDSGANHPQTLLGSGTNSSPSDGENSVAVDIDVGAVKIWLAINGATSYKAKFDTGSYVTRVTANNTAALPATWVTDASNTNIYTQWAEHTAAGGIIPKVIHHMRQAGGL